jgi:hypothetical protein
MGHEYMEMRNSAAAVQCYRNAVNISEVSNAFAYNLHLPCSCVLSSVFFNFFVFSLIIARGMDWAKLTKCFICINMRTITIEKRHIFVLLMQECGALSPIVC